MPTIETHRRRAPEERPTQILDAAFHEFGEHGLAGARLDDIAKRAQVAKGTIYLYFPNKEALFREMVHTTIVAALAEAEASQAESHAETAEAQLRRLGTGWWAFLRTERVQVLQRLVSLELGAFPDLMQFYADEVIARGRRLVAGIIARGVARGEFRDVDPPLAARMFSSIWMSHSTWCARREFFMTLGSDEQVLAEMLEFYLYALRP
ncbi:TetR/AcrR family transcriptional regulator [Gemmatimonas sp.]|uniref:TetR/AcrR family transcriptional regulator n=1 Tax=Gemmatimonas sp. TaxID=1962908 RepID=UPI0037BF0713